jgi:hypothetical protein
VDGQGDTGLRLVAQGAHRHRVGHPLQLPLAEVGEDELPLAGQEAADRLGAQDLAGFGAIAQAAGHHHRGAEVVAGVPQRLTGVEPHPERQALAPDRAARRPLHGHRRPERPGGGGERHHEPVAQPLHLVAAVGGGGLGQQVVMGPEDALGVLVTGPGQEFGRTHQVGEQDGDEAAGVLGHGDDPPRPRTPAARKGSVGHRRMTGGAQQAVEELPRTPRCRLRRSFTTRRVG